MTKTLFIEHDKIEIGDSETGEFTPILESSPQHIHEIYHMYMDSLDTKVELPGDPHSYKISMRDNGDASLIQDGTVLTTWNVGSDQVTKLINTVEQIKDEYGDSVFTIEVSVESERLMDRGEEVFDFGSTRQDRIEIIISFIADLQRFDMAPDWVDTLPVRDFLVEFSSDRTRLIDNATGRFVTYPGYIDETVFTSAVSNTLAKIRSSK